ncbi:ankyrin repeat domain-containing protein 45 isoform X2 [Osmerus mordax]|uniref:ankyrin repeat domain-containing protein 45 isoform X2 n=1 Tax=Osmerus mordax TaxID=8014 RepID=UPI003510B64A
MQSVEEHSILRYALTGDLRGLQEYLETVESLTVSDRESPKYLFKEKDELGRNAFFTACALGRDDIVRELVKHGAEVNELTARGYSPLHYSTLWGQLETVKTLVALGANMQLKNFRGERAIDVASRYSKTDCAEYLNWAEAKQDLVSYISHVRDTVSDPDKVQGKLSKEDKNMCTSICTAKYDWVQTARDPSTQEFIDQKRRLEDTLSTILSKLAILSDATAKTIKA